MTEKTKQRITVQEAIEIIREEVDDCCDENTLETILKELGFDEYIVQGL